MSSPSQRRVVIAGGGGGCWVLGGPTKWEGSCRAGEVPKKFANVCVCVFAFFKGLFLLGLKGYQQDTDYLEAPLETNSGSVLVRDTIASWHLIGGPVKRKNQTQDQCPLVFEFSMLTPQTFQFHSQHLLLILFLMPHPSAPHLRVCPFWSALRFTPDWTGP